MGCGSVWRYALSCALLALVGVSTVHGQAPSPAVSAARTTRQPVASSTSPDRYRKLDPDALITVPPSAQISDTVSTRNFLNDLKSVGGGKALAWKPQYLAESATLAFQAESAEVRRAIWSLEFSFKPVRLIEVPVQGINGETAAKQAWYMMYRVRDLGGHLNPTEDKKTGLFKAVKTDKLADPYFFRPTFELYSHEFKKCYKDEHAPDVVEAVRRREDPNRELLSTRQMAVAKLGKGAEHWGVAVWNARQEVDPRIDFFSIYVRGLTNAYAEQNAADAIKPLPKTLQVNFWRPGDSIGLDESEFRYGLPPDGAAKYNLTQARPHRWVFLAPCARGR